MRKYLKLISALLCLGYILMWAHPVLAVTFNDESLNYRVMYKWGLINKQAGHATLSLSNDGNHYNTQLTAASEKWADRFYKVRDTLAGVIDHRNFRPVIYKKMAHEGGERRHDEVHYSYTDNNVTGSCIRKMWDKKQKLVRDERRSLKATGRTLDMLSSFYFMRSLPFSSMKTGDTQTVNLFSGKQKEILTITYLGLETIEIDSRNYQTYHISFTFTDTTKSKKQTSDPMQAWISADDQRIPLLLEGKLRVGKVQCFYTGSN